MASLAVAQTAQQPAAPSTSGVVINGGYASTPVQAPTVLTPHVTLGIASPNPVGATSSAGGLQVGATSAAIPPAVTQQPIANEAVVSNGSVNAGNTRTGTGPVATIVAPGPQGTSAAQANGETSSTAVSGVAVPAESQSIDVAAAARYYKEHHQRAVRTFTNDDINRLNQQTNTASSGANSALPASDMSAPAAPATSNPAATLPQTDQAKPAPAEPPVAQPKKPAPYTPPQTPPQ